jgi:acyl-CoA reductase-like NAD-dependent aldehyde dehydrogenase
VDGFGTLTTLITPATPAEIEADLEALHEGAKRWVALRTAAKADLLEAVRTCVHRDAKRWAQAAARAKGVDGTPLAGEEWIGGPWPLLYALTRYIATLRAIARNGSPCIAPSRIHERPDGQLVVDVFPNTLYDRVLFTGMRGEVWMEPGVTRDDLPRTMATWYKESAPQPRVALVLGAGNVAAIAPLDVLYKLIADGAVCILKMNPVNEYLGPIFEDALKPLVDGGFLRFAYGGPEVGKLLCSHPLVDEIHITGSDRTHDAIVFGDGPDAAERKRNDDPLMRKPISSELGNVSPTIVVPGPWTDTGIRFQAEQIVTQKLNNDGFNCIASQVLILPADWDGTPKLLAQIDAVMRDAIDRPAYYPGAEQRAETLSAGRTAERFGPNGNGYTARTIVHVDANSDDPAFTTEAFCSVLVVTTLPGEGAAYLRDAVNFANERLWGTLGANVVIHPATQRELAKEFDDAIAALRYGCVAVNAWTAFGFLLAEATWGAFPGHTLGDIRSGIGVVHNSYLFSRAQKSVVYGAFYQPIKPPWFVTNRQVERTGAALVEYEAKPSPITALKVALSALGG